MEKGEESIRCCPVGDRSSVVLSGLDKQRPVFNTVVRTSTCSVSVVELRRYEKSSNLSFSFNEYCIGKKVAARFLFCDFHIDHVTSFSVPQAL